MPEAVSDFLFGVATPTALSLGAIALIISAFARGWILSKFTVETLIQGYKDLVELHKLRADDFKALYETERKRADVLGEVATLAATILERLPVPSSGDKK